MTELNTPTLLLSGLTLPLALSFLLIVLWSDRRKELNQFFGVFMLLVCFWNGGSFIYQALGLLDQVDPGLRNAAVLFVELGFAGSSVALYALTVVLVRSFALRFRWLTFASLLVIFVYRLFLVVPSTAMPEQPQVLPAVFFVLFGGGTLLLLWRYYRKIRSSMLRFGLILFVVGQGVSFLNPQLTITDLSLGISAFASLIISFAILQQEILRPLAERNSQVEAIQRLNLAITRQASLDALLNQIARQAASLLQADGVGIFLHHDGVFQLANVYNLPSSYLTVQMPLGQGIAGRAVQTRQSLALDDYARDWRGSDDLPLAKETFGSLVCSPLIHGDEPVGALLVVAGRQGRLFGREDVYLLELLGAQAVVAIVHSNLLEEQQELNRQVEYARSQLETVLSSTESPVVAVDRDYRLIFANPAARALFPVRDDLPLVGQIPPDALPTRQLFRDIRRNRAHTYELALGDTFYLCHLAPLGYPPRRISGWVAVLNDVTQLKELDRMKSEMVRMTSHDLKNPLQAAMANLELLQDELTDADIHNSEIDDSITQIDKQLSRMNRIIRGILDLERVKIGARNFDYCPPAQIVDRAFDEMAALATDRRIQLVADVPPDLPALACDPDQFERAIINLVENAIKFSPSGASVGVRVRAENGTLVFQVEDSGVGIAEELQPRVFDRFYRANQKGTEHVTGSGLGLSLVKTIVENHHGKVTLTSQVGVGTTFTVTVPLTAVKN